MSNLIRTYFKRQLPSSLIPFSSTQGKFFFKKAIETGHAEIYFQLANYFTTQSEPAFCGLGTLSMVLNSLEVDPLKVWKGPWRWYADEMLDCCRSLSDIRLQGITLSEFECLAKCNGLSSRLSYSNKTTLNQFENDVKLSCQSDNQVMVLSYSRKTLGQTGDGHFSPVGGYDPEEKMVLVLDVARFKYPAYWVPLDLLFESLKPIDPSSGISRGYTLLSKNSFTITSLTQLDLDLKSWKQFLLKIKGISKKEELWHELIQLYNELREFKSDKKEIIQQRILLMKEEDELLPLKKNCKENNNNNNELQTEYITQFELLVASIKNTILYNWIQKNIVIPSSLLQQNPNYLSLLTLFYLSLPYEILFNKEDLLLIQDRINIDNISLQEIIEITCNDCKCNDYNIRLAKSILSNEVATLKQKMINLNNCLNQTTH